MELAREDGSISMLEFEKYKKRIQNKRYVMYYILFDKKPIYVGITNNFDRRRSEHFSRMYREKDSEKKLYKHMYENDIDKYDIVIVAQENKASYIEDLEKEHILHLRLMGYDMMNVSSGGGYRTHSDFGVKESLFRFVEDFDRLENIIIDAEDEFNPSVDISSLENNIDMINVSLLYSVKDYKTISSIDAYDDYIRKHPKERGRLSFDDYVDKYYNLPSRLSPYSIFSSAISGGLVSDFAKDISIHRFMDLVDYLEGVDDPIELYVAIKILMGDSYEDEILPMIRGYDNCRFYDLEEYIKDNGFRDEDMEGIAI